MQERRFHPPQSHPATVICRVCLAPVALNRDRIRLDDVDWVMSCPTCGGTFPVRADDAGISGRTSIGYR